MAPSTPNENDAGKQDRLDFIRDILASHIRLTPLEIRPVAYEDDFPFPYNNYVYAVKFAPGAQALGQQHGTCAIPVAVDECIVRLPNGSSGYNNDIRVENEVAALAIIREALQADFPGLVPRVFAWGSARSSQGWILQELMPGTPLLDDFNSMGDASKAIILKQMAKILAAIQRSTLPTTVQSFGGLKFSSAGELVSAPLSIMNCGPFENYTDFVRATIETKLAKADADPQVVGWRSNGVRARLERFMSEGFPPLMEKMESWPKALVHADFAPDNFLYDKTTMQLTALLDFDFAHVATLSDEFFRSLGSSIGQFPSTRDSKELSTLHSAMLTGFPRPLPKASDEVDWPSAKAWDDALAAAGAAKPSQIKNIHALSDLFWLSGQLLPFKLCNKVVVRNSTPEKLKKWKTEGENRLLEFLGDYGY